MSWATKYRPKSYGEVVGHKPIISAMRSFKKDPPHASLFTGPSGCGKTTLARIFARETLGVPDFAIAERNAANYRGVDAMRKLVESLPYRPPGTDRVVVILDEAHQLTNEAQNLLLKSLEEPPAHVFFALCTTDPADLLPTILTRCVRFDLSPLDAVEIAQLVKSVAEKEGFTVDDDVLAEIAVVSQGSPRFALTIAEVALRSDSPLSVIRSHAASIVGGGILEEEIAGQLIDSFGSSKAVDILNMAFDPEVNRQEFVKALKNIATRKALAEPRLVGLLEQLLVEESMTAVVVAVLKAAQSGIAKVERTKGRFV